MQCDSDLMLARRIKRDVEHRGRTVDGILDQYVLSSQSVLSRSSFIPTGRYLRFVKPSYDNFVRPTASHADIVRRPRMPCPVADSFFLLKIVPGHNNRVAIDLICTHVRRQLQERRNKFRGKMAIPHRYLPSRSGSPTPECKVEDLDLTIHPQTTQVQVRE